MIEHFDPQRQASSVDFSCDYFKKDYGTPSPIPNADAAPVTLEIDGVTVSVPEGTSVLRAAALADINIPKLCATDSWKPLAPAGCAPCR